MRIIKLMCIILIQLLTGCIENEPRYRTHPDFFEYIRDFEYDLGTQVNVSIIYTEVLSSYAVGTCITYEGSGYRYIKIKKSYWEVINEDQRIQLVYHELGHCQLNILNHDESVMANNNSCPNSFMRSRVFTRKEIKQCFSRYIDNYIMDLKIKSGLL